jgi:LPS O-antigen subunit length determinant protein (WzzB/FepE family)
VQSGTATPTGSLLPNRTIWIGAALLAVVVFGVGVLLLRRARTAPQSSLITRSLEREKEP